MKPIVAPPERELAIQSFVFNLSKWFAAASGLKKSRGPPIGRRSVGLQPVNRSECHAKWSSRNVAMKL
jgi:hypothetical protein